MVKVPVRNCINYIMAIKYIISTRFQHFKESKDICEFLRVWLWNLVTIFVRNFFFSFASSNCSHAYTWVRLRQYYLVERSNIFLHELSQNLCRWGIIKIGCLKKLSISLTVKFYKYFFYSLLTFWCYLSFFNAFLLAEYVSLQFDFFKKNIYEL